MQRKFTLYVNDKDREEITILLEALDKKGVALRDSKGNLSTAALFRYLRKQELKRVGK